MIRKTFFLMCILSVCFIGLTGCTEQKVSDIYETNISQNKVSNIESSSQNNIEKKITLSYQSISNEVFYVNEGESAEIKNRKDDYLVIVEEVRAVDNISEFSEIMDQTYEDNIKYWYENIDNNAKLNNNGTLKPDVTGVDRIFLLVKLSITNNSDKKSVFNSSGFKTFNIDREQNKYKVLSEGFEFIDKADEEPVAKNHLTLQAGETKEIVIGSAVPKEIITGYTMVRKEGESGYKDVVAEGSSLESLYMYYSVTGDMFPKGTNVFKLDVEYAGK